MSAQALRKGARPSDEPIFDYDFDFSKFRNKGTDKGFGLHNWHGTPTRIACQAALLLLCIPVSADNTESEHKNAVG